MAKESPFSEVFQTWLHVWATWFTFEVSSLRQWPEATRGPAESLNPPVTKLYTVQSSLGEQTKTTAYINADQWCLHNAFISSGCIRPQTPWSLKTFSQTIYCLQGLDSYGDLWKTGYWPGFCFQHRCNFFQCSWQFIRKNQNKSVFIRCAYLNQILTPTNHILSYKQENASFTNCMKYLAVL